MKSESQIKHKVKQALFRHMKRRIKAGMKRNCSNCKFNREVQGSKGFPNVCVHPEMGVVICDDNYPDISIDPKECPFWEPRLTVDEIKREFTEFAKQSREIIASEMPDVAILLWVLAEEDAEYPLREDFSEIEEEESDSAEANDGDEEEDIHEHEFNPIIPEPLPRFKLRFWRRRRD